MWETEKLQVVLEQVPRTDVKIVMGHMNAKVGMDNAGREEVIGRHVARAEINENGERWADFCQVEQCSPTKSVTRGHGCLLTLVPRTISTL